MEKMKTFVMLALFLSLVTLVSGMNCTYDSTAFISTTQDIEWSCWLDNITDGECVSVVEYKGDVIHVYPKITNVHGIGLVDTFDIKRGFVNIYFGKADLYEDYNYTFKVFCGETNSTRTATFETVVVPVFRDPIEFGYRAIWVKEHLSAILLIIFLLAVICVLIWMMVKS
jgi:hypothetical protein